jgi:hypothetical protein
MKGILGNILDAKTIQAMEVCAAMAAAGASQVKKAALSSEFSSKCLRVYF